MYIYYMKANKFITLDIEGDASASQCRTLFPDANHFDPYTIPWCFTVTSDKHTITYVCKLSDKPREYIINCKPSGIFTKTRHDTGTVVPIGNITFSYEGLQYKSEIIECNSVKELMLKASLILQVCKTKNMTCYCKPFYGHLYDKDLLSVRFDDYNIDKDCLSIIQPYHCFIDSYKQANQLCDNQTFMNNGIRHNVVDCVKLYEHIKNSSK